MSPPSPYDDPVPNGWRLVCASLRIAVALSCCGMAADRFAGSESPPAALLFSLGWLSEEFGMLAADWGAYALVVCGALTLFRPCWPVLLPVVAWVAADAVAPAVMNENPLPTLDQSVTVLAPLALLLIEFWPPALRFSIGRAQFALGLLRVGIVLSLLGQAGLLVREIGHSGELSGLLQGVAESSPFEFVEPSVSRTLAVLAAANAAFALVVLTSRQRIMVFCAAVWSGVLAAMPLVVDGLAGSPAVLIDAPRVGAPLALCWFWTLAVREQSPTIVPAL